MVYVISDTWLTGGRFVSFLRLCRLVRIHQLQVYMENW